MPAISRSAIFNGAFLRDGDFVVTDANGRVSALVEVKKWKTTLPATAIEFAQSVAERWVGITPWFVLITPSDGYAWRVDANEALMQPERFSTPPLLAPYYARLGSDPQHMGPIEFELAVGAWLRDLSVHARPETMSDELWSALRAGDVRHEAA